MLFDQGYVNEIAGKEREAIGREAGAYDKAVSTARNMIRMGFSTEQIAQATELPVEEVAAL